MKKLLILAVGTAALGLGACNRQTCPAYSSAKTAPATLTASTATPVAQQQFSLASSPKPPGLRQRRPGGHAFLPVAFAVFDPLADFNQLVKHLLQPAFKTLGYKKSGATFRCYGASGWGKLVQLQWQGNSAAALSFRVSTGLYLPEADYYVCQQQAKVFFSEPACVVRQSLGRLRGNQQEAWYSLTATADPTPLFAQLFRDFQHYVHPYLASVTSREDIYALLAAGHRSDYLLAQIDALFRAGYRAAALALFTSELTRAKTNFRYQTTLHRLALAVELPPGLWRARVGLLPAHQGARCWLAVACFPYFVS